MNAVKTLALAAAGLCAFICMLCGIVWTQVTSADQMLNGFIRFADTAKAGVPASAYPDYARALTTYLSGQTAQLTVRAQDGSERPGFSEKELRHMYDVRGIVRGLGTLRYVSGGLALIGFGLGWLTGRRQGTREEALLRMLKGAAMGAGALLALILALAVWGSVNFTGLFVTFHRVMFSNDLWLLDPERDLLIMLMPTEFFIWYARQIVLACWPVLALMLLVPVGYRKLKKQGQQR